MTWTPCPDHPNRTNNELGRCVHCARDAQATDQHAGAGHVRAALKAAPRPPIAAEPTNPIHDLALARARADKERKQ